MSKKSLTQKGTTASVDRFLSQIDAAPPVRRNSSQGRLIFAMDATASREHTWETARRLQAEMFNQAMQVGGLDVQLVYFRGFGECKASPWVADGDTLHRFMKSVSCEAGTTQIERVLKHIAREARKKDVHAAVYVGDCVEESIDVLGQQGGELKLLGVPLFIFQEGFEPYADKAFQTLASVTAGAHCRFDANSARELGALLNAAAIYAAGGKSALDKHALTQDATVQGLLKQLK